MMKKITVLLLAVLCVLSSSAKVNLDDYKVYFVKSQGKILPELEEYVNANIADLWSVSEIEVIENGTESQYDKKNAMFIKITDHTDQVVAGNTYYTVSNYIIGAYFHRDLSEDKTKMNSFPSEKISIQKYGHFKEVSQLAGAICLLLQSELISGRRNIKTIQEKTLVIRKSDLNKSIDLNEFQTKYCCKYKFVDDAEYMNILFSDHSDYAILIASTRMADDKVRIGSLSDGTTGSDRETKRYIIDLSNWETLYFFSRNITGGTFGLTKKDLKILNKG